ncbi:hypothetical protein [Sediminicoccus sp. KRV36]|uniref:hypothetical protein n=1 Tax=Sediminicoccus sp. KRV36 TaxID=3133721 RepID=UPI00200FCEE3|nr:hypothetical protein [Sediminicoccus rosea]UPY36555.1 hypothetical protein LHU95_20395 [Sediminicoccus rosea]
MTGMDSGDVFAWALIAAGAAWALTARRLPMGAALAAAALAAMVTKGALFGLV